MDYISRQDALKILNDNKTVICTLDMIIICMSEWSCCLKRLIIFAVSMGCFVNYLIHRILRFMKWINMFRQRHCSSAEKE